MDLLMISRFQFGSTAAFHILWPIMSIGLGFFITFMETMWYITKKDEYYRQVRFWLKIFILTFATGVASGLPLSLEFGTNWAEFSKTAGSYFGNLLGFETTVAFTLETSFLGIMVFGWGKVSKKVHLFSSYMVLLGASLSAFWIMAANTWMQTPQGVHFEEGLAIVDSYKNAIFNAPTIISFLHMWFACIQSTMFLIAGISAATLLNKHATNERKDFFIRSLKFAVYIGAVTALLQFHIGDQSGLNISKNQPEKLAAVEMHYETNEIGKGADWSVVAWPNAENTATQKSVSVPGALSLLTTHSTTGIVQGVNTFPSDEHASRTETIIVFYAFRLMVLCGTLMLLLGAVGVWYFYKKKITVQNVSDKRRLLTAFVLGMPLGFIATESGWMVREIGRQPWVLYHIMKVSDAMSSNLKAPVLVVVIAGIAVLYTIATIGFVVFTHRIVKHGPDFGSQVPWSK